MATVNLTDVKPIDTEGRVPYQASSRKVRAYLRVREQWHRTQGRAVRLRNDLLRRRATLTGSELGQLRRALGHIHDV